MSMCCSLKKTILNDGNIHIGLDELKSLDNVYDSFVRVVGFFNFHYLFAECLMKMKHSMEINSDYLTF